MGEEYPLFRNIFNKAVPNVAKSTVYEKIPLTKDELEILVKHLTETGQWQVLCFLLVAYASASRREELRQLRKEIGDYEKSAGKNYYKAHEVRGKGRGSVGVRHRMLLDERAMQAIKRWLEKRGNDNCPYLFVRKSKNGIATQLSAGTFNVWCNKILSPLVGGKRLHPHLMRSTRATHIVAVDGKDINAVKHLLNHRDPKTSEGYVIRDESEDVDVIFDSQEIFS
ncbi:MAG: Tyrosine recombinase XerC [candidate division WS2 bacterium]|nr:Tyrosine recombinase XerC [Candidatus Psychracetigena formicireducens]